MDEREILSLLNRIGAVIIDSHIVYASGKHGAAYVNKDAIYPYTKETSDLCRAIAERFTNDKVEVVIGPAVGGVILSQWTARHLSEITKCEVFSVYAEKQKMEVGFSPMGGFVIGRGYDKLIADKRVLVVEDILTTGNSAKKVIEAVRNIRGNVIGLGVLVNRGGIVPKDVGDVPIVSLVDIKLDIYEGGNCPLCNQGVPINTEVGHSKEYLAKREAFEKKFISG